jgi:hypothetical protein
LSARSGTPIVSPTSRLTRLLGSMKGINTPWMTQSKPSPECRPGVAIRFQIVRPERLGLRVIFLNYSLGYAPSLPRRPAIAPQFGLREQPKHLCVAAPGPWLSAARVDGVENGTDEGCGTALQSKRR